MFTKSITIDLKMEDQPPPPPPTQKKRHASGTLYAFWICDNASTWHMQALIGSYPHHDHAKIKDRGRHLPTPNKTSKAKN